MRTYLLSALLLLSIVSSATPIEMGHSQYRNLFVFTAKRDMRGADVKVYSAVGDLITAQRLKRRKMVIDFGEVKQGSYRIEVVKGSKKEEFVFEKR